MDPTNQGVLNTGSGTVTINGSAVGAGAAVHHRAVASRAKPAGPPSERAAIGVITVLSVETLAIVEMLRRLHGYRKRSYPDGTWFHEASLDTGGRRIRVAATQALDAGQRSAAVAYQRLRRYYAPPVVVIVGIAGGIHPAVLLDDVVIADEVIYYEQRKETPTAVLRRGHAPQVPAVVRHALNDFFSTRGEPLRLLDGPRSFTVLRGPIGSGEAVIAWRDSEIRRYLDTVNDTTLAVETEAGAIAQACYEEIGADPRLAGWLTIRGISDHADDLKDDAYQWSAARHAAFVLAELLPFLASGQLADS